MANVLTLWYVNYVQSSNILFLIYCADLMSCPLCLHGARCQRLPACVYALCKALLLHYRRQVQVVPCLPFRALVILWCARPQQEETTLAKHARDTLASVQRVQKQEPRLQRGAHRAGGHRSRKASLPGCRLQSRQAPSCPTLFSGRRRSKVRAGTIDRRATGWIPCVCSAQRRGARGSARGLGRGRRGHRTRGGPAPCLPSPRRAARRGEARRPRRGVHGGATTGRAPPCRACMFFRRVRHSAHVGMLCG
jgi:hypothetical protein